MDCRKVPLLTLGTKMHGWLQYGGGLICTVWDFGLNKEVVTFQGSRSEVATW